jgi:hypothetical protein
VEIEREIRQDLAVQVSYVGFQSYHTVHGVDMNSIPPQVCENPAGCVSGGVLAASQRGRVPQGASYIPVGTRPNPLLGGTLSWWFDGTSSYHALNLSLTKRSRGGLMFKSNYSWAKILDLDSGLLTTAAQNDPSLILTPFNLKLSKGPASYSLLHQFNTNASYELPFGRGKAIGGGATGLVDKVIGGWQLNGILNVQGGFPFSLLVGSNRSGNGNSFISDVPDRNPDFQGEVIRGVDGFKKTGLYYDPRAFALPTAGTFGNVSRGALRGPGLWNMDLSLFKRIPINEQWSLQFRTETFNIFNHANFKTPRSVVFEGTNTSGSAGIIDSTVTPGFGRQIQFALRLEF